MGRWATVTCVCGQRMTRRTEGGDLVYRCRACGRQTVRLRPVSERDRVILGMAEAGRCRKDIAWELGMTESAVKGALGRIRRFQQQAGDPRGARLEGTETE